MSRTTRPEGEALDTNGAGTNDNDTNGKDGGAKTSTSQLLAKGLRVLTHIADHGGEVGVRDLARAMAMSTTVTHRLIATLAEQRFLERNGENGRYRIGPQAFEVGKAFLRSAKIETCAPPILRKIVQQTDLNAFLSVMRGANVVYLVAMQDNGPVNIRVAPGTSAPLHATAMGKVLLAELPDDEVRQKLALSFDGKPGGPVAKDASTLLDEIAVVRTRGYAISDEEAFRGVVSVGAPIRDFSQRVVAAIAISKSKAHLREREIEQLIAVALEASEQISRAMGAY